MLRRFLKEVYCFFDRKPWVRIFFLFMGVMLIAVLFRMGPIDFYPEVDERYVVNNLENFFRTGTLEPVEYIHPPFTHYLCAIVMAAYLKATTDRPLYEAFAFYFYNQIDTIVMVCRWVHGFLAISIVPLVFWLSWKITRSEATAFLSSFIVSISYWFASRCWVAVPDFPLTIFFTASLGLLVIALKEQKVKYIYLGAFCGGLAAASKLTGMILLFPLTVSLLWRIDPTRDRIRRPLAMASLSVIGITSAAVGIVYLFDLWLEIILFFSHDRIIDPVSKDYFEIIITRLGVFAAAALVLVGILSVRLSRPDFLNRRFVKHPPPVLSGRFLDRFLIAISQPCTYTAVFLFLTGFLIFNPYWILRFKAFAAEFVHLIIHVQMIGHFGMFGQDWMVYLASLITQEKLAGAFLIAGILLSSFLLKGPKRGWAIFILLMFLHIGTWAEKASRFIFPILPSAAMLGAFVMSRITGNKNRFYFFVIPFAFMSLLINTTAISRYMKKASEIDSRCEAKIWIETHIPSGSRLLVDRYIPNLHTQQTLETIHHNLTRLGMPSVETAYRNFPIYQTQMVELDQVKPGFGNFDYIILSSYDYARYFDLSQVPPPTNPRHKDFIRNREFYQAIFSSEYENLNPVKKIGGDRMAGPELIVYQVKRQN